MSVARETGTGFVGRALRRTEDARFLTGRGRFVDDVTAPDTLHLAVLRSPHAHARIRGIDLAAARAMPGVADAFAFADIAPYAKPIPVRLAPLPGVERFQQRPLAEDVVRYAGEPVAVVVAIDRYRAEDALAAIAVDYDMLPPVVTVAAALAGATPINQAAGDNVGFRYSVGRGDADGAFARAGYTRRVTFRTHRHAAVPLETRGLAATFDRAAGTLTVWGGTKVNFFNRGALAAFLDMAEDRIEIVEPDVGGGFGGRGELYPEDILVPVAAIRAGRPVKWIEDRREHLLSANHSREVECDLEIATTRDGTILALRAAIRADMGAYTRTNGGVVPAKAAQFVPGPYRIPDYACTVAAVMTNKTPVGTYRGPGRYEANFFRERLFDLAAADLGIDRVAFRMKNLLTAADIPYPVGALVPYETPDHLDIGDAAAGLRRVLDAIAYDDIKGLSGRSVDGRLHGIGMACFIESGGGGPGETARFVIRPDSRIELYMGSTTMGQGHETAFAQIAADALGVPFEAIAVFHGTTSFVPIGWGAYASRSMVMGGSAVLQAADAVKARLRAAAAMRLNLAEDEIAIEGGAAVGAADGARLLDFPALVAAVAQVGRADRADAVIDVAETFRNGGVRTYSHGAHAAHVAVDPETGAVEVLRYVTLEDVGRAVNPMLVHGQAIGSAVQGLGGAFLDGFIYGDDGQLLTATFADYLLPTATDFRGIEAIMLEEAPSRTNPLGVKGAGEGGIVAVAGAVANAVADAIGPAGRNLTALPLRPDLIRRLIADAANPTETQT